MNISIRRGKPEDSFDFANLFLMSDPDFFPSLFSPYSENVVKSLFVKPCNLLSFEHTYFILSGNKIVGMLLGYDHKAKKKEEVKTGFLLLRELKFRFFPKLYHVIRSSRAVGNFGKNDYYISNVAIYPNFRRKGLGRKLILKAEEEAKFKRNKKMILEVKTDNKEAISFYKKHKFLFNKGIYALRLKDKNLTFLKAWKPTKK